MSTWHGVKVSAVTSIEDIEVDGESSGYYDPGSMYRSNGDPGDPPEGEDERIIKSVKMLNETFVGERLKTLFQMFPLLEDLCQTALDEADLPQIEPDDPEPVDDAELYGLDDENVREEL